jgi:SAM-dependent methyltransferase
MGLNISLRKPFSRYLPISHVHAGNVEAVKAHRKWVKSHPEEFVYIPCLLCGLSNFETVFENDRYGIQVDTVLCANCGTMFINPAPTLDTVDKFYREGYYDATYRPVVADRPQRQEIEKPIDHDHSYDGWSWYRLLMQSGRSFDSVLEIGAVNGKNLTPFIQGESSVTAIELSGAYAKEIEATGAEVIVGNLWTVKGTFDLIIARHVVEHVSQPIQILELLKEHLSPDGMLVVEVPGTLEKIPSIQLAHLVYLSETTINIAASISGFKIDNFQTFAGGGEMVAIMSHDDPNSSPLAFRTDEYDRVKAVISQSYNLRLRHFVLMHSPPVLRRMNNLIKKLRSRKS